MIYLQQPEYSPIVRIEPRHGFEKFELVSLPRKPGVTNPKVHTLKVLGVLRSVHKAIKLFPSQVEIRESRSDILEKKLDLVDLQEVVRSPALINRLEISLLFLLQNPGDVVVSWHMTYYVKTTTGEDFSLATTLAKDVTNATPGIRAAGITMDVAPTVPPPVVI